MCALSAREGYGLWAPHYADETAVSALEDSAVRALDIATEGRRLLDVGCGVARRLTRSKASFAVGVDLSFEMLAMADDRCMLATADARALPFANDQFDVVWCRLVVGHLPALAPVYAELARVCRAGGSIVVSDLHEDAVVAGHRRTFRDRNGQLRELEHTVHSLDVHRMAAGQVGLALGAHRAAEVGPAIAAFYARANRLDAYAQQLGLPLVSVLAWRKVECGR